MEKKKIAQAAGDENLTLILTRSEVSQVLAVLQQAEGLVGVVDPKGTQNFLGKLIKKIKKAGTKIN